VAAVVAWAAFLRGDGADVQPVEEGALVEGIAGSWQRLNPLYASLNEADQDIAALVFSGLLRVGPDGQPQPDLSALPEVSPDGLTYTFRLQSGLSWHDGAPVTSADVAFTIAALKDPDFRGAPALAEPWADVEITAPDDLTVVFTLPQPVASFAARFATVGILPAHLLTGLDPASLFEAPFNQAPVGTGPYRVASLDASAAELAAFEASSLRSPASVCASSPTTRLRPPPWRTARSTR
jgi:peptide/nickel transport system substrate-binding protein